MFPTYAVKEDISSYMGVSLEDLPANTEVLVSRANELVYMAIKRNYNPDRESHVQAAKYAVCAQVQDWISREADPVANDDIQSYGLGQLSVTYASDSALKNKLCVMSCRYLNDQYLMYKGVL